MGRLRRWLRADGTVEAMVVLDTCLFGWRLISAVSPDGFTEYDWLAGWLAATDQAKRFMSRVLCQESCVKREAKKKTANTHSLCPSQDLLAPPFCLPCMYTTN
jgi:hypothetical protein